MLGRCKVGTGGEHTTCHNGNLRSLRNLHGIHHILHGILHSHSRAQPRPHACRSSHHGSHHSSCSLRILRILHGILRSHSRAQPQPHAYRSSPWCTQDHNHHSLHILHGSLRIRRIRNKAQQRPQVRHRPHACRSSHHGSHRSSCSLRILHGILCSHSRAQPQPHACRSIPCILQGCIHRSLHTHRSLRIHHIRNTARLQPLPRLQARQPQWLPGPH